MVKYCAAFGCKEKFVKGGLITFHKFPKDEARRKVWENKMRRKNFKATDSTSICSKHFKADNFDKMKFGGTWLKKDAIPTIFEFSEKHDKPRRKRKLCTEENAVDNSPEGSSEIVRQPTKKFRYMGDFKEKDMDSPTIARKFLKIASNVVEKKDMQLKDLKKRNKKLEKRVASLEQILDEIKKKDLVSDAASNILQLSLSGSAAKLIQRMESSNENDQYPAELRSFALTLHFYSSRAYDYVRETFDTCLPHPSTLRKWYRCIDGSPGFTKESLKALKNKATEASKNQKKIFCSLIVDEISIRHHVEWDSTSSNFCGYVDYGTDINDDDLPLAKESFTFLINCLNGNWKVPVGYFLIDGLSAKERANLINECLELIHDTGVEVVALTFDGPSVNISTAKILGAQITEDVMKPYFSHPVTKKKIYILLDACHMLKLVRNALASKEIIFDLKGNKINWGYIVKLQKLQEKKQLVAGNKIKKSHIEWQRQKMKVKLAAQVLSNKVADALLYLNDAANDAPDEEDFKAFRGCEATAEFLRCFNNLFDILNSRNLLSKNFNAPLQNSNKDAMYKFLDYAELYIKGLKISSNGPSILSSNRKVGFLGFLTCIYSVKGLYEDLISTNVLNFLLTYKLSQDHIETFFSAIRSRGGFNNNPTAKQFKAAYKRLLCHHEIVASKNANCLNLDDTNILNVSSAINKHADNINLSIYSDDNLSEKHEEMPIDLTNFSKLGKFVEDVVGYIAGFVVKSLRKKIKCSDCIEELSKNPVASPLLLKKNRGGLKIPGNDVVKICRLGEKSFRRLQAENKLKLNHSMQILINYSVAQIESNIFPDVEHIRNQIPLENHRTLLIKAILFEYLKIRLYHHGKIITETLQQKKVRSINSKMTLFMGH